MNPVRNHDFNENHKNIRKDPVSKISNGVNIAIFTKNWLGDVIFETPAIRVIKENFPGSHLIAITPRRCVAVLEANPYVDEIMTFDEKEEDRSFFAKLKFVLNLRTKRIHKVFLFHRSSTRARLAWLAGIPERIGYQTKDGTFLTHAFPEPVGPIHDVEYFIRLVQQAGLPVRGEYAYEFYYQEEDKRQAEALLQKCGLDATRLVAINPGANWPPKRWPAEYFYELAERLIEKYGVQVVLTGSRDDEPVAQFILDSHANSSIFSLCGKTTVRQLGALFSMCQLVISNDTGPLHIAAGVGTNVIGLFGPTQPLETGPLGCGKNIMVQYAPEGVELPWIGKQFEEFPSPWMGLITVGEVFEVIERERLLS